MTPDMFIVFAVLVAAVVLFTTEKLPVDLVAILAMSVLLVAGIITPEEGIAGFSNTATVIVGVMFIVSAGLFKTGAVNAFGAILAALGKKSIWVSLLIIMGIMGVLSSFMSNTAAVAVFIPIVIGMAKLGYDLQRPNSKLKITRPVRIMVVIRSKSLRSRLRLPVSYAVPK